MRKTLLMSVALLGLSGPVFAQGRDSSTNSPPAPNASTGQPQPASWQRHRDVQQGRRCRRWAGARNGPRHVRDAPDARPAARDDFGRDG